MADFIGRYTKKFEANPSKITKSRSDGYVYGTYRFKLDNGEVAEFLKKYFKEISLVKKLSKDECDHNEATEAWNECLSISGEEKFFSFEREWLKKKHYDFVVKSMKGKLDFSERVIKEMIWSLVAVKRFDGAVEFLSELDLESDTFFDDFYDKRYAENSINRFKKSDSSDGKSEREILRSLLPVKKEELPKEEVKEEVPSPVVEEKKEEKVEEPVVVETPAEPIPEETKEDVKEEVVEEKKETPKKKSGKMSEKVIEKLNERKTKVTISTCPYRLLINERFPIYATPSRAMMKTFLAPGIYSIFEENNGFGRLKHGSWVDLSMKFIEFVDNKC